MTDQDLLSLAADLAMRASEAILQIRAQGFEVGCKDDRSPVTAADHAAEAIIVQGLRRHTPHITVVAEEEIAGGYTPEPAGEMWLVDPLDGTRGFAAGGDDFAVNIGLVREGRPVLGVVAVPVPGELFGGIVGQGAWKRIGAKTFPIRTRVPPLEGLAVLASRHHGRDDRLSQFLEGRDVASIGHIGSALKFCRVAEGAADLYPRFGPTMEWDTAAPQAVLEAAGGALRSLPDQLTLQYGKPGWRNPGFICTGAGIGTAGDGA